VVSKDERESGLRAILNFGHTIGHAIETVTGYKRFLHGEAIAMGMCAASALAVKLGLFQSEEADQIQSLIGLYKLPTAIPHDIEVSKILDAMRIDKKVKGGHIRFVLPESIGKVKIEEHIDSTLIKDAITELQ
jgi:3-dehydroquinate synthase